jgi:hypothetical protein
MADPCVINAVSSEKAGLDGLNSRDYTPPANYKIIRYSRPVCNI